MFSKYCRIYPRRTRPSITLLVYVAIGTRNNRSWLGRFKLIGIHIYAFEHCTLDVYDVSFKHTSTLGWKIV